MKRFLLWCLGIFIVCSSASAGQWRDDRGYQVVVQLAVACALLWPVWAWLRDRNDRRRGNAWTRYGRL